MLTDFKVSSLASKCVYYRPEHTANRRYLKLNFEGLVECKDEINQWKKAQRLDKKQVHMPGYHVLELSLLKRQKWRFHIFSADDSKENSQTLGVTCKCI